ncbi:MAG: hypothetical protein HW416_1954 [Chloroflexi bacterium]|nr:hypothetical protein [Chloroflexota bacterium]
MIFDGFRAANGAVVALFLAVIAGLTVTGVALASFQVSLSALAGPGVPIAAMVAVNLLRLGGMAVIILWLGLLRLIDVGLKWSQLPSSFLWTAAVWVGAQVIALVIAVLEGSAVTLDERWKDPGAIALLGRLGYQVVGVALFEEVAYRGFLLPQCYLWVRRQWPARPVIHLPVAMLVSQGAFSVSHVPLLLYAGMHGVDLLLFLVGIAVFGAFFAAVYMRSGNLFLAMGVHVLVTTPTVLIATTAVDWALIAAAALALLAGWTLVDDATMARARWLKLG